MELGEMYFDKVGARKFFLIWVNNPDHLDCPNKSAEAAADYLVFELKAPQNENTIDLERAAAKLFEAILREEKQS